MEHLSPHEITAMFLALGVLLLSARVLGELSRYFGLPAVLGEILAGILLGPTVFGRLLPLWSGYIFPTQGSGALVLDGLTTLAIALFLLVAGIEIDLATAWRQGKVAALVALLGMLAPFTLGFAAAWWAPGALGYQPGAGHLPFALFMATALSITALPIIVKILMDLNLYRSDLGVTLVAAAVLNDLLGWLIMAVVLGMVGMDHGLGLPLGYTLVLVFGFALVMLTLVPRLIDRILPWLQAYTSWPGGVLGFALTLCLFAAAFTEWIGIHAIFGSFLAGVALGQSRHLREQTRTTIDQFISFIFAPLFFASIGLRVDFLANFDLLLTLTVLALAVTGKVLGSALGGHLGGLPKREAWAAGCGMSAQGTMGIILGVLALQVGLISQTVFVSLVVMALVTSLLSGPLLQRLLHLKKPRRMINFLGSEAFQSQLEGHDRTGAINELSRLLVAVTKLPLEKITAAVLEREALMATGIGMGVAVPHARIEGLERPHIAVGLSPHGIDFDAPDGIPAHIICLILTPVQDDGAQLEILADIAATFRNEELRDRVEHATSHTEFLALIKSAHKA